MNKLQTFFSTLFKSATSPGYYQDVLVAPSSFSWKYFLFFHVLLSLVVIAQVMVPVSMFNLVAAVDEVTALYPADLTVKVEDARVSINQPLPYSIPLPAHWTEEIDSNLKNQMEVNEIPVAEAENMNLVTFVDEGDITSIQDVYLLNSLAVITPSTVYVLSDTDTGEVKAYAVTQTDEPIEVSSEMVATAKQAFLNFPAVKHKWYVPVIGLVLLICVFPFIVLGRIITLAIYSVAVLIISSLFFKPKNLKYGDIYRLSLHAITQVVLLTLGLDLVREFVPTLAKYSIQGWSYFILFLIWMVMVINALPNEVSAAKVITTHKTATKKKK